MALQDFISNIQQYDIVGAIIIVVIGFIVGQIAKFIMKKVAKRLAKKTKTSLDDELIEAMEAPILWAITTIGVFIALLTLKSLAPYDNIIIIVAKIVGIIWGCWAIIRVVAALFRWYATEIAVKTKSDMDDKYLHIFQRIINIAIYAIVFMLLLSAVGIQITPLIAGLGIGGLAIGLALQDTLANFFAGFWLISDRAVKIGDYVEIEAPTGTVKGHVTDIGWRTSKLKTLTDNYVIVPNSSFANATVLNYQVPKPEMTLVIPVGVSYTSDLENVEKVTKEVITDTLRTVKGCVKDAEPGIRYKEFADSSINFICLVRIRKPEMQGFIRHEFIKKLKSRYDKEGIEIPFPIRTIHMSK